MDTQVDEIADGIYRISTFVELAGLRFNQYLVDAEEPLLFHTGQRGLFPLVAEAVGRVRPVESLRWISWGHLESDESGAMNEWLGVAPAAEIAVGFLAGILSVNDLADRPPRLLGDDEVIDLGGKRIRYLPTPHVPHGWDAGVMFEETTGTLLCGDLFTQQGDGPAISDGDLIGPAMAAEDAFGATALTPLTAPTIAGLAALEPSVLALMHGPAWSGDGRSALADLAGSYAERLAAALNGQGS
ncbi:MAG: MBL fold metallo-hydrolase [Actinobacteria bacterium]|nr:MBL fold metallo-hydrolase [Actinomycetota bacterium]